MSQRAGIVCGIARKPSGAEVVVRLGWEQWIIATVDPDSIDAWQLSVGRAVLVDQTACPLSLRPRQE